VAVNASEDLAEGVVAEEAGGEGQFERVVLRPRVTTSPSSDAGLAKRLHETAHEKCFSARFVAFAVTHEPVIVGAGEPVAGVPIAPEDNRKSK
jgi:organic hydroperoxide reductase OsmC/OhrA